MAVVEAGDCVVVTGGAGFIGSHTVEAALSRGYGVIVVDSLYSGSLANIPPGGPGPEIVAVELADIRDLDVLVEAIRFHGAKCSISGIIHLAALVNVAEAEDRPLEAFSVNAGGTLSVLEASRRLDIERVVLASSVAVYGEPRYLPVDEEHPLEPANIYGESKVAAERLLAYYTRSYGIRGVALRYFNVYGPRMRPGPYAGVVYNFISALMKGRTPTIYGDGSQTRDFVYVKDVAEANIVALESGYVGAVNIGSGRETSIGELYRIICDLVGRCPKPRHGPPRPGDVRRSQASIERARTALGWKPRTSLEAGLRETVSFYLQRGPR